MDYSPGTRRRCLDPEVVLNPKVALDSEVILNPEVSFGPGGRFEPGGCSRPGGRLGTWRFLQTLRSYLGTGGRFEPESRFGPGGLFEPGGCSGPRGRLGTRRFLQTLSSYLGPEGTILCLPRQDYSQYLFGFRILPLGSWPLSSSYAVFYFCRKSLTCLEGAGMDAGVGAGASLNRNLEAVSYPRPG
ncbi:hypothetical protein F2Q69_00005873 [Brassica cretica]|uniref:Uncharacterized protein n=1 Tax=Brassica cretica TaxID=69181 RepID=A0A8S9P6H5_BRACR|nr:hypothetical protein F2Q69_00005873 [Brassica cretica]